MPAFCEPHRRERRFFTSEADERPRPLHLEAQSLHGRVPRSGPSGRVHSEFRRNQASGEARARAFPARGRGRGGGAGAGLAAPACAGHGAGRAEGRGKAPFDRVAARVLAAARPGTSPLRGRAEAGRRHRALGPPGRRPLGHADGFAGRGAALGRERQRPRCRRGLAGAAGFGGDPWARRRQAGASGRRPDARDGDGPPGARRGHGRRRG